MAEPIKSVTIKDWENVQRTFCLQLAKKMKAGLNVFWREDRAWKDYGKRWAEMQSK